MIQLNQPDLKLMEYLAQQQSDCVSFAQGALRVGGVSQKIKDYVRSILETDKADYYSHSLGMASLREKLAMHLSARHSASIASENIFISHGSIAGIASLCLLLLEAGDEVLLPEPTYPAYLNAVTLAKGQVKFIPANQLNENKRWILDLDMLESTLSSKTKMIIIAHPSNPCGVCLTQEELQKLVIWCQEKRIYLIIDEAYDNYFFDMDPVSSTALVPQFEYLIRAGSFSKTFGMSGWRIGYIVAPKIVVQHMAAVQDGLTVCPSVVGQYAALYALDHPEISEIYTPMVKKNRDLVVGGLAELQEKELISYANPPAGFFLFIKTNEQDTSYLAHDILNKAQVSLVPGKDFGPSGKNYLRLCYARPENLIEKGIDRLLNYYRNK